MGLTETGRGVMIPRKRIGHKLHPETETTGITQFCYEDTIIQVCTGKKEYYSVLTESRKKKHRQKYQILNSLKDIYTEFNER